MSSPRFYLRVCSLLLATTLGCSRPAEKLFEVSTDASTRTGMFPLQDGVVVVNEGGFITSVRHDGAVRWRLPLGRELASRPVEARGILVATSVAGEWFGVDAASGRMVWQVPRQPVTRGALLSDGARVYGVLADGGVRAVDAATGAVLWNRPAPARIGASPLASPILVASGLVVSLGDAGLVSLAWEDGAQRWRSDSVALGMTPAADGKRLFVAGRGQRVSALDAATGAVVWTRAIEADLTTAPTLIQDRLYVGAGSRLLALDPATGEPRWLAELDAPVAPVAVQGTTLLVPTSGKEGRLYLFQPPKTRPYASVRVDSPLRVAPIAFADRVLVLASDGRVLGYRLTPPTRD
ncbi:MAG: PQQ-binding-like beta-propeller repeat protein [Myxococcota bacterium]|nr:PQQ-binding-like beta-propeller repeat protein [Myxococcota bacterium]